MRGLIKYDLMQITSGIKGGFVAAYLGLMIILSFFVDNGWMYSYIFVFLSAMFGIAAFNYEELYHWDRYTASLPLTNRQIVLARYGMIGICVTVGTAMGIVLAAISFLTGTAGMPVKEWGMMMLLCLIGAVLYMEILIPIMYRMGAERGRIVMLILFCVMFALLGVCGTIVSDAASGVLAMLQMEWIYIMIGGIAIVGAWMPVSIHISARIRAEKEY